MLPVLEFKFNNGITVKRKYCFFFFLQRPTRKKNCEKYFEFNIKVEKVTWECIQLSQHLSGIWCWTYPWGLCTQARSVCEPSAHRFLLFFLACWPQSSLLSVSEMLGLQMDATFIPFDMDYGGLNSIVCMFAEQVLYPLNLPPNSEPLCD